MRKTAVKRNTKTETTHPMEIKALAQQARGQRPADVADRPERLRDGSPPGPLPRLCHLDDDDGRHGNYSRGPYALHHAGADQRVHGRAPGRGARARHEQQKARDEHGFAPRGVRYVGEDELEDGLRQQVARRQGEDLDLGGVLVLGDSLCSVKGLCVSRLILLLPLQLVVEGPRGVQGSCRRLTAKVTATAAMSNWRRNGSTHEQANSAHFLHFGRFNSIFGSCSVCSTCPGVGWGPRPGL